MNELNALLRSIEAKLYPKPKPTFKESLACRTVLRESSGKDGQKIVRVILVTEGLGNRGAMNYYGPEAISSAPEVFEGAGVFLDHPTEAEESDIPERKVKAKCGYYKNLKVVKVPEKKGSSKMVSACAGDLIFDSSEDGERGYQKALTAIKYAKDFPNSETEYVGLSVNADGGSVRRTVEVEGERVEVNYVTRFLPSDSNSADIVTVPARGGRFVACVEDGFGGARMVRLEAGMKVKKLLESALAGFKKLVEAKDDAAKTEAAKAVETALTRAIEADGAAPEKMDPMEEAEAMCAKREGESPEDHMSRLKHLAGALKKHVDGAGEEPAPAAPAAKESAETMEAKRIAVKALLSEAKVPKDVYGDDDIDALVKLPLKEAKREIQKAARLAESIQRDTVDKIHGGIAFVGQGSKQGAEADTANKAKFVEANRKGRN